MSWDIYNVNRNKATKENREPIFIDMPLDKLIELSKIDDLGVYKNKQNPELFIWNGKTYTDEDTMIDVRKLDIRINILILKINYFFRILTFRKPRITYTNLIKMKKYLLDENW
jgi:hypothetical protein